MPPPLQQALTNKEIQEQLANQMIKDTDTEVVRIKNQIKEQQHVIDNLNALHDLKLQAAQLVLQQHESHLLRIQLQAYHLQIAKEKIAKHHQAMIDAAHSDQVVPDNKPAQPPGIDITTTTKEKTNSTSHTFKTDEVDYGA